MTVVALGRRTAPAPCRLTPPASAPLGRVPVTAMRWSPPGATPAPPAPPRGSRPLQRRPASLPPDDTEPRWRLHRRSHRGRAARAGAPGRSRPGRGRDAPRGRGEVPFDAGVKMHGDLGPGAGRPGGDGEGPRPRPCSRSAGRCCEGGAVHAVLGCGAEGTPPGLRMRSPGRRCGCSPLARAPGPLAGGRGSPGAPCAAGCSSSAWRASSTLPGRMPSSSRPRLPRGGHPPGDGHRRPPA